MHLVFVSRFTGKSQKAWHFVFYLFLLLALEWMVSGIALSGILGIGTELLVLYGMSRFALKNCRKVSWVAAILAIYISQLSFGMVNSIEAILFPCLIGKPLLYFLVFFAAMFSLGICFCCYMSVLKSVSLKEETGVSDLGLLLFPAIFFFIAELYILQIFYTQAASTASFVLFSAESGKHIVLLLMQMLGLGALISIAHAYQSICQGMQTRSALYSLTQAARAQKVYIAEAQMRYEKTRAFRHDIRNHLSILKSLLQNGKIEESRAYLQKLEQVSASLSFPYHTGNPAVDILLGEKLGQAKENGIAAEVSLCLPKLESVDDFDFCVIFANALDNAINACQCVEGERSISICGEQQGDFYRLAFKNTCLAGSVPSMGTGLSNIQTVAEKYHGAMLTEKTDSCFHLHVLLDISSYGSSSF